MRVLNAVRVDMLIFCWRIETFFSPFWNKKCNRFGYSPPEWW